MKKAIIVDIDGTLANIDHRKKYIQQNSAAKKNWPAFFRAMNLDTIHEWCFDLVQSMYTNGYIILLITGRDEDYRKTTADWLEKMMTTHSYSFSYHLLMRATGDYRPDYIIKKELYIKYIQNNWNILFAIEDRKQAVDMWRSIGVTCLQCDEGNF